MKFISKAYKGYLVQQTEMGWIIPMLPDWSLGPVSQGPFGTYQIACQVIDRIIGDSL